MSRIPRALAVVGVSAGTLAYEILLIRAFAIEHFYHFAYMAIGVAMFGFGASGTFLALAKPLTRRLPDEALTWSSLLTAVSLIASPALVHRIQFDPTQLVWDASQWIGLVLVYLLLALPFCIGGLAVLLAIALERERPGLIYGASFLGSGLGATLAILALSLMLPVQALAVPAALASGGALCAARGAPVRSLRGAAPYAVLIASVLVVLRPAWKLQVTPHKALPQVEAYPDAQRIAERKSAIGWVVAVDAPAFRHAPGLSLAFRGTFPKQVGLFVDGELADAATVWPDDSTAFAVLDWLPTALPYALGNHARVLVIGAGGGTEIANALVHGANAVVGVELHPQLVSLSQQFAQLPALMDRVDAVEWIVGDARHYVARTQDTFDLITLGPVGSVTSAAAGVHALGEDFVHTVDAYSRYLQLLTENGMLAITRWLTIPPRETVRVTLTAAEALRRADVNKTARGLVVARSWGTVTVLARPAGFTESDIHALQSWAVDRRFDLDWYPDLEAPSERFNELDDPTLFNTARAAVTGTESAVRYASAYEFDVAPVGDARPYPHHFLRARSLGPFLTSGRGTWLPFAEWGYLALIATLVQSVVLAAGLLILPVSVGTWRRGMHGLPRLIIYFAAIGVAYMAAEIAAIQQLSLLLGHPVYAVAAVLAAFLICSGVGSVWSDRATRTWGRTSTSVLAISLAFYALVLLRLVHLIQPAHISVRVAAAVILLAPIAFLMGAPFPLGLRKLAGGLTDRTAWSWAANGFGSVVGAPLAALLAVELGSPVLFLVAAAAYGLAALFIGVDQPREAAPL